MNESHLFGEFKRAIAKYNSRGVMIQRHEDAYQEGIPDLSLMNLKGTYWLELKHAKKLGRKPSTTFKIRVSQKIWTYERLFNPGIFWLFKVDSPFTVYLIPNELFHQIPWAAFTWSTFQARNLLLNDKPLIAQPLLRHMQEWQDVEGRADH